MGCCWERQQMAKAQQTHMALLLLPLGQYSFFIMTRMSRAGGASWRCDPRDACPSGPPGTESSRRRRPLTPILPASGLHQLVQVFWRHDVRRRRRRPDPRSRGSQRRARGHDADRACMSTDKALLYSNSSSSAALVDGSVLAADARCAPTTKSCPRLLDFSSWGVRRAVL